MNDSLSQVAYLIVKSWQSLRKDSDIDYSLYYICYMSAMYAMEYAIDVVEYAIDVVESEMSEKGRDLH